MVVAERPADFMSAGTRCGATLYRPDAGRPPPVVVMADGFGCERSWRLPAFAERFTDRGLAVLSFDYRGFGDSDGRRRQVVSPRGQRRDWLAAVEYARTLPDVDGDRLALWGSSFSGGHVLAVAARDGGVDAVVAQVPFSDGVRTVLHLARSGGAGYAGRAALAALRDLGRWVTGRAPHDVPIAADPDAFAVLNRPGTLAGFEAISGGAWENRCAARIFLTVPWYRPVGRARRISCPTLVVEAEDDPIIHAETLDRLVERLDDVERVRYPVGHFDVYTGATFERVADREAEFLVRHLLE